MAIETIETVEISNAVDESPAISWAAVVGGAVAAVALNSRSPRIRCWHGLLVGIPVGQFGRIDQHIPN
jgi:hypothetical protein